MCDIWASIVSQQIKNTPANAGDVRHIHSILGSGRAPGGGTWQPTTVFFPGKSHGQRSLVATVHGFPKNRT